MASKCCDALIDRDDDGDLICTKCFGLCKPFEVDLEDSLFMEDEDIEEAIEDIFPDRGGTGHGDDSLSDADPGL